MSPQKGAEEAERKSLEPEEPALLSSAQTPEPWSRHEKELPSRCAVSTAHLPSLPERFSDLSDSKTLNHSGVHLLSAITVPSLRFLGVVAVADKTNEIPALRQLVEPIDLDGRSVGMDGLHAQDETVQKLLYGKGADYPGG